MAKRFTREEKSWIMYDWANSAQSAIIAAIILPIFFKEIAKGSGVADHDASSYWGYATSIATLICALSAPLLGALGDYPGYKKKCFALFVGVGVAGTALLAFAGSWQLMLIFYIISTIGFGISGIYYDSFLNDVTTPERTDLVSTFGYGFGYIGGSTIPLVISLGLILYGEQIGISSTLATRFSFLLTAVWWGVFTIPMLRHVKQTHATPRQAGLIKQTLPQLGRTLSEIVKHKAVLFFLIAYFFYIDGVGTIIHMATVFGDSMGIDATSMMLVLLVVQIVAFPFAILYGYLAKRFGTRKILLLGIFTYLVVCVVGLRLRTLTDFLVLGALVGTAQGGLQALSRSYFSRLIPAERSGEFFGFFDIFGKFSAVVGPSLFGLIAQATQAVNNGVYAVMGMFIIGGGILLFLVPANEKRIA